jgi:hypothetical protein
MKNNESTASNAAECLLLLFDQNFTSYAQIKPLQEYMSLPMYTQEIFGPEFIKKSYRTGKTLSCFVFEDRTKKKAVIFIHDRGKEEFVSMYCVDNNIVHQYKPKGADSISRKRVQSGQGAVMLSSAKDFLQEKIAVEFKILQPSESPFTFSECA